jgi:hypothetical protein
VNLLALAEYARYPLLLSHGGGNGDAGGMSNRTPVVTGCVTGPLDTGDGGREIGGGG